MKNFKTITGLLLSAAIVILTANESSSKELPCSSEECCIEATMPIVENQTVFKIYDRNDSLVYKCEVSKGQSPEADLVSFLNKSDLLINHSNQKIYRLK